MVQSPADALGVREQHGALWRTRSQGCSMTVEEGKKEISLLFLLANNKLEQ